MRSGSSRGAPTAAELASDVEEIVVGNAFCTARRALEFAAARLDALVEKPEERTIAEILNAPGRRRAARQRRVRE